MRTAVALLALTLGLACSTDAQQSSTAAPADTAARIGDRTISVQEIDDRWRAADPIEQAKTIQALYEGRRAALDDLIASFLIEEAAKAKGVDAAQFLDAEIARRVTPVGDADVAAFYDENRGQMQGRPLEQVAPLIRKFLEDRERERARTLLVTELRKAGPAIRVLLEAPRREVEVVSDDPSLGPVNAPVTVVEFSDFQCPFCQRAAPTFKTLRARYGDRIRFVWKDFPLTQIHPDAFDAAMAGHCAGEQGKFWEYHDKLFANQTALDREALKRYAAEGGLDAAKFSACIDSGKYRPRVQSALDSGVRLGVGSTPTTFINGRPVSGAQDVEVFAAVIEEELARAGK